MSFSEFEEYMLDIGFTERTIDRLEQLIQNAPKRRVDKLRERIYDDAENGANYLDLIVSLSPKVSHD